jgi:hypothetical protein
MAWKINLAIETIDPARRDALLEAITDTLREHASGVDKATCKVEREVKTSRGKRKIVDTIEWLIAVEEPPDLGDFGLADETPMERAMRNLSGTEISTGGRTVRVA